MPKTFRIANWEEYQHGSGVKRTYPWIKLHGSLFRRPWFIKMKPVFRLATVCLLDYAKENHNKMPLDLEVFFQIYHIDSKSKEIQTWFNTLIENGFVASTKLAECYPNASPIREEKIREDKRRIPPTPLEGAWCAFEEMRKKIKKPLTGKARVLLSKKLQDLTNGNVQAKIEILNQSTMNCWQGLFALNAPDSRTIFKDSGQEMIEYSKRRKSDVSNEA